MRKKLIITETGLRNIIREEIKNQTIFVNPSNVKDLEPIDYDYLINRNKGLPDEYFEPTDIPYDPNEVAMYTIPSEVSYQTDLNEGLTRIYPTVKALDFVCTNLMNKGYPIRPDNFQINCPNDDRTIYGHILLMVVLNYLNKEINDILINSFNACGYTLGKTFNRIDNNGNKCVVFQFEPKFQINVTNPNMGDFLYHVTTANAAKKIMQQGFCPSNRTKNGFKYDSRCYFFTIYNKQLFTNYTTQANKQNIVGKNTFNNDFKVITRSKTIPDNIVSTDAIYKMATELFFSNWNGCGVRLLGITVSGFEENDQLSLFGEDVKSKQNRVDESVDELRSKFGFNSVVRASIIDKKNRKI